MILQSNPLLHWIPVQDDLESIEDSSQDSNSQMRRSDSQRSIISQISVKSNSSYSRQNRSKNITCSRPSSLLISPPESPRPAFRSKSTDDNFNLGNNSQNYQKIHSTPNIDQESPKSIFVPIPGPVTSLGKFNKIKDCFTGASIPNSQTGEESDDESTPLVSELSSPSHSNSDNVFRNDVSPCDSNDFSQSSGRSLSKGAGGGVGGGQSCDIEDFESMSLIVRDDSRTKLLSRQNAENWENPETPV